MKYLKDILICLILIGVGGAIGASIVSYVRYDVKKEAKQKYEFKLDSLTRVPIMRPLMRTEHGTIINYYTDGEQEYYVAERAYGTVSVVVK